MRSLLVPLNGKHGAGRHAIVDAADWLRVAGYRWHVTTQPRSDGTFGLMVVRAKRIGEGPRGHITMAAQIMGKLRYVYTVNGNGLDCRRSNLELRPHGKIQARTRNLPRSLSDVGSRI